MFDFKNLKKIRKQLNLTQTEFARRADVSQSMIAKIESGRLDPTYANATKIITTLEELAKEEEKKAGDFLTKKVLSVRKTDKITKIAKLMKGNDISQMPVLEDHKVVGLVTEHSILDALAEGDVSKLTVEDVMEQAPPVIPANTGFKAIASMLQFFPIVLVAKKGKFIGVITKADLIESIVR